MKAKVWRPRNPFWREAIVWLSAVALIGVLFLGVLAWLGFVVADSLEAECHKRCEARGKEVASFTIFGCDCKEEENDT